MKKIVLSLAGVMAAVAFAPEASALPAFARQTGMACAACHNQHFPVLNGFGRAFKAAGYTMMGAQEKIEGEHLSIPAVMNTAILFKGRFQKDNSPKAAAGVANGPGDGHVQFGDEFSLFFGGRVAENAGFLFEGNTAALGGNLLAGFKMPMSYDAGVASLVVVPFTTDALDASYGFELSSGGVMRANRWMEHRKESSAVQYVSSAGAATGVAFAAHNPMGFVTFTKYSPNFAMGANGGQHPSYSMGSSLLRIAATPEVAGFALVAGVGVRTGVSYEGAGTLVGVATESKQTFADVQAQGDLAGNEISLYAQYATAPAANVATGIASAYNAGGTVAKTALTLGVDYSLIPHTLHLGGAVRMAKNGLQDANLASMTDNAVTVAAIYDMTQNIAFHINHSNYSGSATTVTLANPTPVTRLTTLMLEAAW